MMGTTQRVAALGAVLFCGGILAAVAQTAPQAASPYDEGKAAFKSGEYAKAAELFANAASSDSVNSDALLLEGKSLANIGKFSEADGALRRYTLLHPESADAFFMLGFVLHREDKPADSLRAYTQAAALNTPKAEDLRIVGLDYVLLDDYPDAIPVSYTHLDVYKRQGVQRGEWPAFVQCSGERAGGECGWLCHGAGWTRTGGADAGRDRDLRLATGVGSAGLRQLPCSGAL